MKRLLIAAASLAALGLAAPAFAADAGESASTTVTINGSADALCHISAESATVNLDSGSLINDNARVRPNVTNQIVNALNDLHLRAWCNGASNTVALGRTALTRTGGTNWSSLLPDGFAQVVSYDLLFGIDGAIRSDQGGNALSLGGLDYALDGTEDGATMGPVTVGRFGPDGAGAAVRFAANHVNGTAHAATIASGNADDNGATSGFVDQGNTRLAAGDYQGEVTITLTPGV